MGKENKQPKEKTKVLYLTKKNADKIEQLFDSDPALAEKTLELTKKRAKIGIILSYIYPFAVILWFTPFFFSTYKFMLGVQSLQEEKYNILSRASVFVGAFVWSMVRYALSTIGIGKNKMYERYIVPADVKL